MMRTCSLERSGSFGAALRSMPVPSRANSLVQSSPARSRLHNNSTTALHCVPRLPDRRQKRDAKVAAHTAQDPGCTLRATKDTDPFHAASTRLQSLLAGVGDGDAEMVDSMVSEESPESRLSMQVVLSAAITGVALTVSMLCGNDPWGGASMSLDSVVSAGVGLTAVLPLVILRAWTWTPQATAVMPALEDMHMQQLNIQAPWFCGTAPWHVMTMVALEVLPMTMLLLPAAQGGLMASVHFYTMALQSMGAPGGASVETLQLSCLALTAAGAALTKGLELAVSDHEFEVVQAAVDNSDRYYRLMSMDVTSRGGNATRAALAFRSVAGAWMEARNDASLAAMGLCALDVMAMGGLWYMTGDLAAPAAAAMALNGVDAWHMHKAVTRREAQVSMASGSGRGPSQPSA